MDRILQNTAGTIYGRFYSAGVGTNPSPDSATVTITRADGTVLVASTAATDVPGVGNEGKFSFNLTTSHTALLDRLTAAWTSNLGTITTTVEVAGGFVFTTAQARTYPPLNDTTKYPQERLEAMRVMVEQALEDECGVAFVPRYERERITGPLGNTPWNLRTRWAKVRSVRSATVGGTALSAAELLTVVPNGGVFYYPTGWTYATYTSAVVADITVGYEHGYDTPPARVTQAAILLAKRWLVQGPIDDRTTTMSTEDGTFTLATPGLRGSSFGIPEVDVVADSYRLTAVV